MSNWFTLDRIDNETFILSEYRHWEETHCYLVCGGEKALLIDTGLGIRDISAEVRRLTDLPVTAVATHVHWDHIGGHKYYPDFYAHSEELDWLNGKFPLSLETVREMVLDLFTVSKVVSVVSSIYHTAPITPLFSTGGVVGTLVSFLV